MLCVLFLGAGCRGGGGAPAAEATDDATDDLVAFVEETVEAADAYWRNLFRRMGLEYTRPRIVIARHGVPTPGACDEEGEPLVVEDSYCGRDATITLDVDSDDADAFTSEVNAGRPMVVVYTVGHEWGHHIQSLLDLDGLPEFPANVRFELQADCLAGLFTRSYQRASDWVGRGDVADAIASAGESGDPDDMPGHERTHGTAAERERAFRMGYDARSAASCGLMPP